MVEIWRILCPIGFSERSRHAMQTIHEGRLWKTISRDLADGGKRRADLIAIGVRGRNALELTVFGSTTNQVVRRASCPVLTLKHQLR